MDVRTCSPPDNNTRAILSTVSKAYPNKPVVGIVDYNPKGVEILLNYRFGSKTNSLDTDGLQVELG
jgi:DNA topoisomerase VI subunit A